MCSQALRSTKYNETRIGDTKMNLERTIAREIEGARRDALTDNTRASARTKEVTEQISGTVRELIASANHDKKAV